MSSDYSDYTDSGIVKVLIALLLLGLAVEIGLCGKGKGHPDPPEQEYQGWGVPGT